MRVLQIASSNMEFFREQVRILEQKGIDCDVLYSTTRDTDYHTNDHGIASQLLNRIYGHNLLYYTVQAGAFYPRILRKSIFEEYDIVHVNSGMVAPFGVMQLQRPLVTTLWGDDLLGNRLYGYQSAITKQCAKYSDETIVRSEEMLKSLPCDAHIIPSGVDLEKFLPIDQSDAQAELGWDLQAKHVLFPYHPSQSKKRYPVAEEIVNTIDRTVDDSVILQTIHGVPHNKMNYYYSAADALLLPSLREGSPNTVKEAMACNLPVVSTNVGDVHTRLNPVSHSHVCNSKEGLVTALTEVINKGERSDGRTHVESVSLDTMGDRLITIYENLL